MKNESFKLEFNKVMKRLRNESAPEHDETGAGLF